MKQEGEAHMDAEHFGRRSHKSPLALTVVAAATALSCNDATQLERSEELAAETTATTQFPPIPTGRSSFTLFESGQVRPLALSPDRQHLFAVNTPDNRLEVFRIDGGRLRHTGSISVGLEPVAVAARSDLEVWVVNHLSDSVSVVVLDPDGQSGHVDRTLLVGDEPRDIVFAGPRGQRAFITTAHRGQNIPFDPQPTVPGIGRADVWVFDADALARTAEAAPLTIITLFTDTPRALAVSPDGSRVYAAGFHTGNRTTIIGEQALPDGFGPDGAAGPATSADGKPAPEVGAIVQWNGSHWVDSLGRSRDDAVKLALPDKDVFAIDAAATPPQQLSGAAGFFQGVGTVLYSMVVNPVSGKVYVANTNANNLERFEGPGIFAGHSLRGHLHESRITVLGPDGSVAPRHLNKHIDYTQCCQPAPNAESVRSLALPQGMAVSDDGATLYVAALGSDKIGVFATQELEDDTFKPSAESHIAVTGGGPTGVVLDQSHGQLYVLTRFDNAISIIDTASRREIAHLAMHNPEPASVIAGRRFLYDASFSSSHGDSSCASCHVFGDLDSLAWDLGNPDGQSIPAPGPFAIPPFNPFTGQFVDQSFHPMKGPMTTQSLRGMANHGPMHWRGDRTGGNDAPSVQPDGGSFDERAAFARFQAGFTDLLGRNTTIPPEAMDAFTDFVLQMTYPPNPNQPLDGSLTPLQAAGRQLFETLEFPNPGCLDGSCGPLLCTTCHVLDPAANAGSSAPGFFGAAGLESFDFRPQLLKVPHLRNLYQKVGMFGNAPNATLLPGDNDFTGDQIRGFGFQHDGEVDTIFRFHKAIPFSELIAGPGRGLLVGPDGDVQRRKLEAFVLAFPTNLAPSVGQQVTLTFASSAAMLSRADLLRQRAEAGDCDLVARAEILRREVGFVYLGKGWFASDRRGRRPISESGLRGLATLLGRKVTFTCVPRGTGVRVGVDRDDDGFWDGDESDAHSDPADALSIPGAPQ
jgi:DNA-binding beta-propeller fold protein YncE